MPIRMACVKPLSSVVIHDGATFITPHLAAAAIAGCPNARSVAPRLFLNLVVHLRDFSGYVDGKVAVRFWPFTQAWRKKTPGGYDANVAREVGG